MSIKHQIEKIDKNILYYILLIAFMVIFKMGGVPVGSDVLYYGLVKELYLLDLSIVERFSHGGEFYINLMPVLVSFIVLKIFNIIDHFPIAVYIFSYAAGAVGLSIILSKKFERFVPDLNFRIAIMLCLYFFPPMDMSFYYTQSSYLFLLPIYYYIILSEQKTLQKLQVIAIALLAPLFISGKPISICFGLFFAYLLIRKMYEFITSKEVDIVSVMCLLYINALYVFQMWYTFIYNHYAFAEKFDVLQSLEKSLDLLGLSVTIFIARLSNISFISTVETAIGLIFFILLLYSIIQFVKKSHKDRLMLLSYVLLTCAFTMHEVVRLPWLFSPVFVENSYLSWSVRVLFPFVILSFFIIVYWVQDLSPQFKKAGLCFLILLSTLSLFVRQPARLAVDFYWEETRKFIAEDVAFIPSGTDPIFYYARGLNFFKWYMPATLSENKVIEFKHDVKQRQIMYVLVSQNFNKDSFALLQDDSLNIVIDDNVLKAKLINPGLNKHYLFKFKEFIPVEYLKNMQIKSSAFDAQDVEIKVSFVGAR